MQVTRKDISDTKVKLTITLGLEELVHAKQHELQEQAKSVKVAGFRKGKAPLTVVEKQLDENQLQVSVINHAINDFYGKAVEEQKLRTLNQPDVTIGKFVPFTELEFVAEVEIMPKVKLGDYKKIKKTVAKVTVTEKDVEDVLSNLRSQMAEKKDSEKPAKKGDDVIIDFTGTDNEGKAVSGASGTDYSLNLGSNSFIPGFEDGLIGVKKGDTKELKLSFPKDYHAQTLAGTAITFNVTVMNVKSVTLPEVNDEFAAKVGPFKTAKELNADIKKQLEEQKQQEALNKMKDELVEELVKKSEFKLPEVLVNDQIAMLEQDFSQNLVYRGMTKAEYLNQAGFKDEEEWKKNELQPQAERRVSVGMVLAEVAEQEAITVTNEEIAERTQLYKVQYQQNADQFDQPEMQREVASRLLTEKTVDRLVKIAIKK
jgi:trigger factor